MLRCYCVLQAAKEPGVQDILRTAYELVQERTAELDAALRYAFLENVAAHWAIVADLRK